MTARPVTRRDLVRGVGLGAVALGLVGCSASSPATQGTAVNAGSGTADRLITIDSARRKPAPELSGPLVGGGTFELAAWRGSPVVVNVWASWCGPCADEEPDLVAAERKLAGSGVRFLGLDEQDDRANAMAFRRKYDVRYPSLFDPTGSLLLRFRNVVPPAAIPLTIVLDAQHRVGGIRIGPITTDTLTALVGQVTGS